MKSRVKKWMGVAALSAVMTVGAAGGIAYSQMAHADLVKAETANYYAERSNVFSGEGELTQTKSATFTLTGVEAGQYSVTVEITHTEGTSQDWFDLSATGTGDTVFLTEGNTTGMYYGVVNVAKDGTLTISSTSPNTLTVKVSLDTLTMDADRSYYLNNVHFASNYSPISIDISGTEARNFTVQVDLGNRTLIEGETLRASINGAQQYLTHQPSSVATYAATISLPEDVETATTLTITSTIEKADNENDIIGSVTLFPLGTITPITDNTATAKDVPLWETAIFSYTPSKSGYVSVEVTSPTQGVESITTGTTVSLTAGTFSGTVITDETYPVYLQEETTYFFETVVEGINPDTLESADIKITISDWQKPEEISVGTRALPVTPAEVISTKFNLTGEFNLSIIDVPFNYYTAETPIVITAHIGGHAIELTRDNNYSAVVDITADDTVYFTTSDDAYTTLTFSFEEYQAINYITLGKATEITVPANGKITYTVQAAAAGTYSVVLASPNAAISVYGEDEEHAMIPANTSAGGFVVRYDGVDYGIEFRNSSDQEITITATVSADTNATLHLGADNSVALSAGERRSLFIYSLSAGTFDVTVDPATDIALTVDNVPVTFTNGKTTITIDSDQEEYGVVNFTFTNTGTPAQPVNYKVTITPTSNIINANETFTITTSEYSYVTTYYANVIAGQSYALTLDIPEGMSVTVSQNGESLVLYGGHEGAFTANYTGYVALRFICYTYGDINELTVHFIDSSAMPINTAIEVDTAKMSTYVAYLYPGAYHIDLSEGANVKIAINSFEITGNSFEVYVYGGVTITFITEGNATFNATLVPENIITLDTETDIALNEYASIYYYINLNEGTYQITVSNAQNLRVQLDGVNIVAVNGNTYVFTVESGYHTIGFINTEVSALTLKATVSIANMLVPDEENNVTIEEGTYSKTYYINLTEGEYTIALTLSDGTRIQVTVNGEVVVAYGATEGNFTITADNAGYVQVIFTTESDAAVTFTVEVYKA